MAAIHQLVLAKSITASFPQSAVMRMEMPAEAIMATTAGRREFRTPWSTSMFRYFRYRRAIRVTMMQEGRMQPAVAMSAPGMPAILMPTKVAELMAIGPGVIWEMVMRSVNSLMLSHPWISTICSWIRGMAA